MSNLTLEEIEAREEQIKKDKIEAAVQAKLEAEELKIKKALLKKQEKEEQKRREQEEFLEERRQQDGEFALAIEKGLPITFGDKECFVYRVFDKESLRLLKIKGDLGFVAIDRVNKHVFSDSIERVLMKFVDYELEKMMPRQRNGSTDIRAVYDAIPLAKIDFNLEKDFEFEEDGFVTFNLYTPPSYLSAGGCEVPEFIEFVEHLFPVESERAVTMSYLKQALIGRVESKQLYLVGDQGVGKGVLYDTYKNLFSNNVVTKGSPKTLDKQFKPDFSRLRLLYIDEFVMREGDSSRAEARAMSEEEVSIEQKFFDERTVVSKTSFILSSNEISKLCFYPSERRPLVPTLAKKNLEDVFDDAWIEELKRKCSEDDDYKKGVYNYLMKFEDLPRRKVHTRYLELITLASASKPIAKVIDDVLAGEFQSLAPNRMYPLDDFVDHKYKRRSIKDSTMGHWLSNFIWKERRFFKYSARNPFHITWLGCPEEFIKDYRKDIDIEEDEQVFKKSKRESQL